MVADRLLVGLPLEEAERLHAEHRGQRLKGMNVDAIDGLALCDAPRGRVADARANRKLARVRPALPGEVLVEAPADRHANTIAYNLRVDKSYTEAYNSRTTLQEHDMRGPSTYEVIERPSNESLGLYEKLDDARGCVASGRLSDYEIWQGDHIVEEARLGAVRWPGGLVGGIPVFNQANADFVERRNARGASAPSAKREPTPEEQEIARLNRVLEMHLADERLLDWVGSSDARMAAVIETFYEDGGISLRRAIQSATEQKPEIPASAATETADPF